MVVIGERDDVEGGDVASVGEVVLGSAGAVGERRVSVQIAPQDRQVFARHHQRVRLRLEARGALSPQTYDAFLGAREGYRRETARVGAQSERSRHLETRLGFEDAVIVNLGAGIARRIERYGTKLESVAGFRGARNQ